MENKKIILISIMLVLMVFIDGCAQPSKLLQEKKPVYLEDSEYVSLDVSVSELVNKPIQYINKTIQVEATLNFIGENYWAGKGNFFLEDNNYKIQVVSWGPITVAHCPPDIKNCKEPLTMLDYLDKKIKLTGVFIEFQNQEYIIADVTNVSVIQK